MHEIFISYSRHDASVARALSSALSERGHSVWLDRSGIREGDAFDTQIEEAIARTRVVVVIWSQHSIRSHWVRAEAAYALRKQKLLPISIDQSEPPLQFLQIQTLAFNHWDQSSKSSEFQQLLTALSKRLDNVIPSGNAGQNSGAAAAPQLLPQPGNQNSIVALYYSWLRAVGLRFPESVIEREFVEYFRDRTFVIAQFSIMLAFVTNAAYGVVDIASDTGGIVSTRFRYMFVCPLMLVFFGLSFLDFAKRHSQNFIAVFGVSASICLYILVALITNETPFNVAHGNGTMNFMLGMGFLALIPVSFIYCLLLGAFLSALHALIMINASLPLGTTWLNYMHVGSMWMVACCIAYWRERLHRQSFATELS